MSANREKKSPPSRGDEYVIPMPLPGAGPAMPHSAFVMSEPRLAVETGFALLASSHKNAKWPYAFWLAGQEGYRFVGNPSDRGPFIVERPIGVEQMRAVDARRLHPANGVLTSGAFDGAHATKGFGANHAMMVQFALPGYGNALKVLGFEDDFGACNPECAQWSVWSTRESNEQCRVVLVISNNKHNEHASHVQALPVLDGAKHAANSTLHHQTEWNFGGLDRPVVSFRMRVLSKPGGAAPYLDRYLGTIGANEVEHIQMVLMAILGLKLATGFGASAAV